MRERKVRRGGRVYQMAVRQAEAEPVQEDAKPALESARTEPAEVTPPRDCLGIPVPEARWPVFVAAAEFAEARQLFARLADVLDRIAQAPAGAAYRLKLRRKVEGSKVTFESDLLRSAFAELLRAEPYCAYCPLCELVFPGFSSPACRVCQGRGWTTQAGFAACPEGHRQAMLLLKERKTE
jgi:hypothetical protein